MRIFNLIIVILVFSSKLHSQNTPIIEDYISDKTFFKEMLKENDIYSFEYEEKNFEHNYFFKSYYQFDDNFLLKKYQQTSESDESREYIFEYSENKRIKVYSYYNNIIEDEIIYNYLEDYIKIESSTGMDVIITFENFESDNPYLEKAVKTISSEAIWGSIKYFLNAEDEIVAETGGGHGGFGYQIYYELDNKKPKYGYKKYFNFEGITKESTIEYLYENSLLVKIIEKENGTNNIISSSKFKYH